MPPVLARRRFALLAVGAALAVCGAAAAAQSSGKLLATAYAVAPAKSGSPASRAVGACRPGANWGVSRPDLAERILELVNAHRARLGIRKLRAMPALERSARWKARHMARYGYMDHYDPAPPVARGVPQRLAACGFAGKGGSENIAYGFRDPQVVMNAWLRSPGHRANIENPAWTVIGIGAAHSAQGSFFWAQNFGVAGKMTRVRSR